MGLSTLFYNTGIRLYKASISLAARIGRSKKAGLWLDGRKKVWAGLEAAMSGDLPVIWIHAASLGEFEQGRPVLEAIRAKYPRHRILLTFFSPSGYEVRKDYKGADFVSYLPLDTAANARRFIDAVHPQLAIFIKYEFWYHYLTTLKERNIPLLLISGIFRKDQVFFRNYGGLFRRLLRGISHIFVQNEESRDFLNSIGVQQVTMAGDTRFDRVAEMRRNPQPLPVIERFLHTTNTIVAGSTWHGDEKLLAEWWYSGGAESRQLIIAPHEIQETHLRQIEALFPDAIRYSAYTDQNATVLLIDNVGMLSTLYRYGRVAYVGGGFGKEGVHNVLEPATYGKPVVMGPVFQQFHEARMLVQLAGALVIENVADLRRHMDDLADEYYYDQTSDISARFVEAHQGATQKVLDYIENRGLLLGKR